MGGDDRDRDESEGRTSTGSARTERGGASTGSARTGEGDPGGPGAAEPALGPDDRIQCGRNREVQIVRNPRRKLFNRERKKVFLEWFAATSNLGWAAEIAGVTRQTVSKHLLSDPEFRGGYDEALEVSRLRLKAKTLETKRSEPKLGIDGEIEAPDIDMEPERALAVLREHEREVKLGRKQGRTPRVAERRGAAGAGEAGEGARGASEEAGGVRGVIRRRAAGVLRYGPSTGSVPTQDERFS